MPARVATVTLNPAIDQTISIPNFAAGQVNRVEWEQSDPGGKGVNVAAFLADFGSPVSVTGFLGAGNTEIFRSFFAAKGIEDHFVIGARPDQGQRQDPGSAEQADHRHQPAGFALLAGKLRQPEDRDRPTGGGSRLVRAVGQHTGRHA